MNTQLQRKIAEFNGSEKEKKRGLNNPYTLKEIFFKVSEHLLKQNKKSVVKGGFDFCKYRFNELKCAVGILIRDEFYDPVCEGESVMVNFNFRNGETRAKTILINSLYKSGVPLNTETFSMLQNLQDIHDQKFVNTWEEKLVELGKEYGFID